MNGFHRAHQKSGISRPVTSGAGVHRGRRRAALLLWIMACAIAAGVCSTPLVFGHGPEPFPGEASWDPSYVTPKSTEARALNAGPSVHVALNFSSFRPGQSLAIGFNIQGPPGDAADLVLGVILPDGQTVILFSRFGAVTFSGPLTSLSALPVETVLPGFSFNNPGFLQVALLSNIPTGSYVVFAALLQQGALANNQLVVLAADTKTFTFWLLSKICGRLEVREDRRGHGSARVRCRDRFGTRRRFWW